jgi:hypothetical protein
MIEPIFPTIAYETANCWEGFPLGIIHDAMKSWAGITFLTLSERGIRQTVFESSAHLSVLFLFVLSWVTNPYPFAHSLRVRRNFSPSLRFGTTEIFILFLEKHIHSSIAIPVVDIVRSSTKGTGLSEDINLDDPPE